MTRAAAAVALVAALAGGCAEKARPSGDPPPRKVAPAPRTTDPAIALTNLDAQIAGREAIAARDPGDVENGRLVVDLLLARATYTSRIVDVERADAVAQGLVERGPESAGAHLARASTLGALHHFDAALVEIHAAERDAPGPAARARAGIFLAQGRYDEAAATGALRPGDRPDAVELATAAVLAGERADPAEAERLFDRAAGAYRDVSPFPVAWVNYQHGWLLERRGDLAGAKALYAASVAVLPTFVHACVHLAALETPARASELLAPLIATSDDPGVAAAYADALRRLGRAAEALPYVRASRAGYADLVRRHPEAFADHAASFELGLGGDLGRALALARGNAANRPTEAAIDLWITAASAQGDRREVCEAAAKGATLRYATASFRATLDTLRPGCERSATGVR